MDTKMKVTIEHLIDKNNKVDVTKLRTFLRGQLKLLKQTPISSNRFTTKAVYDAEDFILQTFFWEWSKDKRIFVDVIE